MNVKDLVPPFERRHATQSVLAAMVVAMMPGAANAEAARVMFTRGPTTATNADGATRDLQRGADIESGDTIRTGTGRVQLRFTDGAIVSLKPDTEFRVDEYQFKDGSGQEERGFFSLLRGGLRTITGLIGRSRRDSYRMRTPVATIGIRGTGYNLDLLTTATGVQQLKWNVADGTISVQLADGTWLTFSAGGAGTATREQFQALLLALSQLADEGGLEGVTVEDVLEVFAAGDVVNSNGDSILLPDATRAPPPDCASANPGCAIAGAFGFSSRPDAVFVDGGEGNLTTVFDTDGALVSYRTPSEGQEIFVTDGLEGAFVSNGNRGSAVGVVDGSAYFSVDPNDPRDPRTIATWGRWIAPGTTGGDFPHPAALSGRDTFAYVISIPPPSTPAVGTGTYVLNGFTPPAVNGPGAAALGAPGVVTGNLTANFGANSVNVNMTVPFANGTYRVRDQNGLNMFRYPTFRGTGNPFFQGGLSVNGTGVACVESCNGYASGNLFGPRADGAAMGYLIRDFDLETHITGATVFQQTGYDAGGAPRAP